MSSETDVLQYGFKKKSSTVICTSMYWLLYIYKIWIHFTLHRERQFAKFEKYYI